MKSKMVTRSIYIEKALYERLRAASQQAGASLVISRLIEMWLDRKVLISIEPNEGNNE